MELAESPLSIGKSGMSGAISASVHFGAATQNDFLKGGWLPAGYLQGADFKLKLLEKLFGTSSQRELKSIYPIVDKIETLAGEYEALTDTQLQAKTLEFKGCLNAGETLDGILPEAFAACREAARRVLGMYPYRVQLIGGIILHQGRIAEMKTGEGKTLVAALPAYLNALSGNGVHVVTVNDYLAKRDSEQMGKIYRFMGLSVGLIVQGVKGAEKHAAYAADITYGTNNEFGFDYLRDNMALSLGEQVQRNHAFAIVDEVDSILIDEARTPLIISGQGEASGQLYMAADLFVSGLKYQRITSVDNKEEEAADIDADYIVDEKAKTATLTARGVEKAERAFNVVNLSDIENTTLAHHINQALKARGVMRRDIDYVVKDGEVLIVDEFTGRIMYGRRYNEGLHQAIEAKEGVEIANESKTFATITFQNYFRLYSKLSGMTGTAMTEREEFESTYKLDIVEIPTNKPVIRVDHPDVVYKNTEGKLRAIAAQIEECHAKGQPVLVGTVSVEKSEELSALLKQKGIPHKVLNAKNHEQEAEIVAQAGKFGAVTVATNMAGRGTDIMLGGNAEFLAKADLRRAGFTEEQICEATGFGDTEDDGILTARNMFASLEKHYKKEIRAEADKVKAAGGLFILGTERHESRRIDNQLRGRSGRQGDPGESRFFLSLEDDIMRLFGAHRVAGMMDKLNIDEDTPIDAKILSGAIESAQRQVESQNFHIRKSVLQYDDVVNTQREIIYKQRDEVLRGADVQEPIQKMIRSMIRNTLLSNLNEQGQMDEVSFQDAMTLFRNLFLEPADLWLSDEELQKLNIEQLTDMVYEKAKDVYDQKEQAFGASVMRELERVFMLRTVDEFWMDHIDAMDDLRKGIGLRAYAQTDPVVAYKEEGYEMFEAMIAAIQQETARRLFLVRLQQAPPPDGPEPTVSVE